ncbi:ABC transporter substrate-binding protein [Leisingera sp. ANG-Vp]|uniref:ABC transporter substrate-binding protein n=1 Tax=Leisingera sp. ANG-Vp TaxID=1577896 RepID=UPI00057F71C8|nr:ABC transporter substrate-binding protein [Leisingera sp. ANG-Vp]KIC17011.1 cobalamin ABC transporter substrate-binding protein [Leisingera sp. ANG-Vp]
MRRLPGIALALLWAATGALAGPSRVVSMNLCTDQLAMLLAAPGQLASVSYIARDSRASAMADEAMAYPVNHGQAEEIYLLKPDLVIAGAFSTPATTSMLQRLGVPVVVFQPADSLEDVRQRILEMGRVLGREQAAHELLAGYDKQLALLQPADGPRPRAALYAANNYTAGPKSLAGQILEASGLENIAAGMGYARSGKMPLEVLAMAEPDLLVGTSPYPRASRSEDNLAHPVVQQLAAQSGAGQMRDADWVCGTPHVLRAVQNLSEERRLFLQKEHGE